MIEGQTEGHVPFQPRARLLKLIGAELISDEVVAVTELVKNSHDADATSVILRFIGASEPGGQLVVEDDGTGLDLETLLNRWMHPAASDKASREGYRTARGRRVLGEKGVGRFAADKLASHLELVSRPPGSGIEVCARFDWNQCDSADRLLSDVRWRWETRPASEIARHGTLLRLTGLRTCWTERMFRRLCNRLARLRPPIRVQDDFAIRIESDEFPDYSGELRSDYLDRSPYRIEARFDGHTGIVTSVNGGKQVRQHWNVLPGLSCGPLTVRIHAFDLETDSIARIGPRMEVRAWLKEWSGISVYRDGFRVWPYGEPHDDWLRLDQRRVNNPVVKLSNNQVVGFVEIGGDSNPELRDQTSREGLISNPALADLRRFTHFVLQILETERQALRRPLTRRPAGGSGRRSQQSLSGSLHKLASKVPPDVADELTRLARKAEEDHAREELQHRRFIDGYSDLAALGHAAIALQESVQPQLEEIVRACDDIARLRDPASTEVVAQVKRIDRLVESVRNRVGLLAPLEGGIGRRRRNIDVPAEVDATLSMLDPLLETAEVDAIIDEPADGVLRIEMRPETLGRIIHILTLNSLDWIRNREERRIRVKMWPEDDLCHILFSDSGPGIPPDLADRVFDPLFSTKEGGRGMGLTIARDIIHQHGGRIFIDTDQRRKGANIHLILPRRGTRATNHRG